MPFTTVCRRGDLLGINDSTVVIYLYLPSRGEAVNLICTSVTLTFTKEWMVLWLRLLHNVKQEVKIGITS